MKANKQKLKIKRGVDLWNTAKKIIPGGNQLLSKRAEMFLPDQWPSYYKKAKGIQVWDLDGNKYLDFSIMSVGSCMLGYADPDVNRAVVNAIQRGSICTLNPPEEVELAKLLCRIHPWADMVRFARSGGEAMAVAVRIARAYSGKDRIVFCGYHGWFDWYLAANLSHKKNLDGHLLPGLEPKGVPRGLEGTALPFHYNRIEELEEIISRHKDIGVIAMEPFRDHKPKNNFLEKVRRIADSIGAVLIFDEISIGWRMNIGGVHMKYGVYPDVAVFAKAISNGYPLSAIIGRRDVMEAAQETFISSTNWTERVGPVAALATIKKMKECKLPQHINRIGTMIGKGWEMCAKKHELKIKVSGPPPFISFCFDYGPKSNALRTFFTQEMLRRGFLASGGVYVSYAHTPSLVKKYLIAVDNVFGTIKNALAKNKVGDLLHGPEAHTGFKRLT